MTNGIFWVGQQTQLNYFARSDRNLAWIHIGFLCAICLTPFSTSLARRIHPLPHRASRLLVQHPRPRTHASLELELRHPRPSPRRRPPTRNSSRSNPPHRHRSVSLCRRRRPLFHQHLLQHRRHRSRASELRHRPQILLGTLLPQVVGRLRRKLLGKSKRAGEDSPRIIQEKARAHLGARLLRTENREAAFLPSLKRVLLLQLLHRRPHRALKSFCLPHQPRSRFRPLPVHAHQPIPRHQPPRDFQQVCRRSLQILRVRRIPNPNL